MASPSQVHFFGRCDALQVTVKVTGAASLAGTVKIQAPSAVSTQSPPPALWLFRSTSCPLSSLNRHAHSY